MSVLPYVDGTSSLSVYSLLVLAASWIRSSFADVLYLSDEKGCLGSPDYLFFLHHVLQPSMRNRLRHFRESTPVSNMFPYLYRYFIDFELHWSQCKLVAMATQLFRMLFDWDMVPAVEYEFVQSRYATHLKAFQESLRDLPVAATYHKLHGAVLEQIGEWTSEQRMHRRLRLQQKHNDTLHGVKTCVGNFWKVGSTSGLRTESVNIPAKLLDHERRVFSQHGDDGVIDRIFKLVGTRNRRYVEIGAQTGHECMSRYLRSMKGWRGIVIDNDNHNTHIEMWRETVTAQNINKLLQEIPELFGQKSLPSDFDFLSIDVDGSDFVLWHALHPSQWQPRVVVIETHAREDEMVCVNAGNSGGSSVLAMQRLAKVKNYTAVHYLQPNLYLIRNDVLAQAEACGARFEELNYTFSPMEEQTLPQLRYISAKRYLAHRPGDIPVHILME